MLIAVPPIIQAMPVPSKPTEPKQEVEIHGGGYTGKIVITSVLAISCAYLVYSMAIDDNENNDIIVEIAVVGAVILFFALPIWYFSQSYE